MTAKAQNDEKKSQSDMHPTSGHDTLVVGEIARWRAEGRVMPPLDGLQFIDISELTETVMHQGAPSIILSPLVTDDFDAVDIAEKLIALQFKGRYRAIAEDLPDTELIRQEVLNTAPELDFDLLLMPSNTIAKGNH